MNAVVHLHACSAHVSNVILCAARMLITCSRSSLTKASSQAALPSVPCQAIAAMHHSDAAAVRKLALQAVVCADMLEECTPFAAILLVSGVVTQPGWAHASADLIPRLPNCSNRAMYGCVRLRF